jgi:hypothetical protein
VRARRPRFRALITLDSTGGSARKIRGQYADPACFLMAGARQPGRPGSVRHLSAGTRGDRERLLCPGDHAVMAVSMTDDAANFLSTGCQFRLWCRGIAGRDAASGKAYADYPPS